MGHNLKTCFFRQQLETIERTTTNIIFRINIVREKKINKKTKKNKKTEKHETQVNKTDKSTTKKNFTQ
jgi:hypothetical protein